MNYLEKVAYLKGLTDGVELDTTTKEGKVLKAVIEALDEIAQVLADVEETTAAVGSELDDLSQDLADVEDVLFDEEEDGDYEDEEDEEYYELKCPSCGEEITISEHILEEGKINCPSCGEELELELGCDCDDEDCDCDDSNITHLHKDEE